MRTARALIASLGQRGVRLEAAAAGKLRCSPRERVDAASLEKLKHHKREILAVLAEAVSEKKSLAVEPSQITARGP